MADVEEEDTCEVGVAICVVPAGDDISAIGVSASSGAGARRSCVV